MKKWTINGVKPISHRINIDTLQIHPLPYTAVLFQHILVYEKNDFAEIFKHL